MHRDLIEASFPCGKPSTITGWMTERPSEPGDIYRSILQLSIKFIIIISKRNSSVWVLFFNLDINTRFNDRENLPLHLQDWFVSVETLWIEFERVIFWCKNTGYFRSYVVVAVGRYVRQFSLMNIPRVKLGMASFQAYLSGHWNRLTVAEYPQDHPWQPSSEEHWHADWGVVMGSWWAIWIPMALWWNTSNNRYNYPPTGQYNRVEWIVSRVVREALQC